MAGTKKLLVADDSLTIQKVIRLALSNEGYEIEAVSDGNDAIQQISLFRPDAVLIDVSLPGKTAVEVKQAINEQGDFPELRFILMSSAFEKVDEEQVAAAEFHGRLTKPFDPAHLRQVLSEVLAQVAAKRIEATSIIERPNVMQTEREKRAPAPEPAAAAPAPMSAMISLIPPEEIELAPAGHEELLEPIRPAEVEPIISPPGDSVSDLWESKDPSPLPPMGEKIEQGHDSDIRNLTESTFRMSGLDEWNVNDTAKKIDLPELDLQTQQPAFRPEPSLPPYPQMSDVGGSKFQLDPPTDSLPDYMPPLALGGTEEKTRPLETSNAYFDAPVTEEDNEPTLILRQDQAAVNIMQTSPVPPSAPPAMASTDQVVPVNAAQIEEIVQKQLQETVEKMARQILPDIAERLIKQEISRMLNEKL